MKHQFLTLFSLFSIASFCHAQTASLQVGVVGGVTQTMLTRQNNSFHPTIFEKDNRVAAGLSAKYSFTKLFLKADLLYENKGAKTDISFYDANGNINWTGYLDFNYHYLSLPVLVGVEIMQTGLYLNAGPYAATLLRQSESLDGPEANKPQGSLTTQTQHWKKMDYGFSGGIGYARSVGASIQVSAEIRHNEGLRNISKGPIGFKTRSTALLVGVLYVLTGK